MPPTEYVFGQRLRLDWRQPSSVIQEPEDGSGVTAKVVAAAAEEEEAAAAAVTMVVP